MCLPLQVSPGTVGIPKLGSKSSGESGWSPETDTKGQSSRPGSVTYKSRDLRRVVYLVWVSWKSGNNKAGFAEL